jgi:hypothetical protein
MAQLILSTNLDRIGGMSALPTIGFDTRGVNRLEDGGAFRAADEGCAVRFSSPATRNGCGLGACREDMMDKYIHLRQKARDAFELRYKQTIDPTRT